MRKKKKQLQVIHAAMSGDVDKAVKLFSGKDGKSPLRLCFVEHEKGQYTLYDPQPEHEPDKVYTKEEAEAACGNFKGALFITTCSPKEIKRLSEDKDDWAVKMLVKMEGATVVATRHPEANELKKGKTKTKVNYYDEQEKSAEGDSHGN